MDGLLAIVRNGRDFREYSVGFHRDATTEHTLYPIITIYGIPKVIVDGMEHFCSSILHVQGVHMQPFG